MVKSAKSNFQRAPGGSLCWAVSQGAKQWTILGRGYPVKDLLFGPSIIKLPAMGQHKAGPSERNSDLFCKLYQSAISALFI